MAVKITSREELEEWLRDKPQGWVRVIALRSALRRLPGLADPRNWLDERVDADLTKRVLRALAISSAAAHYSTVDATIVASARAAAVDAIEAANSADSYVAARAAYAVADAANSAAANVAYVAYASNAAVSNSSDLWGVVQEDCRKIESGTTIDLVRQMPLWPYPPDWWSKSWNAARRWLSASEEDFDIWREWYHGRVQGLPRAFKNFDEAADREFHKFVIAQEDDWWKRAPGVVNADIKAKVEELRRPPPPSDEEFAQEPRAFTFSLTADGRSDLDSETLPNGLQGDEDERDNHSEILRLIDAASLATSGDTNAKDMDEPTQLLREAVGETVEELRPRMFVLRARELMRQVEEREGGESLKPALSEKQRDAYVPLVAALGMIAEFSPKLAELWYGKLGQTGPPLTREMLDLIAQAFRQSQQTTELAQSIIEASNALVDPEAPEDDAARIAASETSRNVVRKIGGAIKKADEGAKSVDRVVRLSDRAIKIWNSLKGRLPSDETIARILEWISGGA